MPRFPKTKKEIFVEHHQQGRALVTVTMFGFENQASTVDCSKKT